MNELIDAYAHIGYPRYGSADELAAVWRQWGVTAGCVALPPGMPDFAGLGRARELLGDAVRVFGIPYGDDPKARADLAELQIRFGVSGMRLMPREALENPDVLSILGEAGRCLMTINIYDSAELTRAMIAWLERFPNGTIAAPHFLRTAPIDGTDCAPAVADPGAFRDLLRHPRMHAIFSRHGGVSARSYPHSDLRPWVEDVIRYAGWERVLWGSEIPVIYHRDEQVDQAAAWLDALGLIPGPDAEASYLAKNARRVFFSSPPPSAEHVAFPAWVEAGLRRFVDANDAVPVVRSGPLALPLDLHGRLMSAYLADQAHRPSLRFQQWLVERLNTIETGSSRT